MSGASQPASSIRFLISGTAAAASGRLTVTRTISEPASASSTHCAAVARASAVSVMVIDCTTTGAAPPTWTCPTRTPTVLCSLSVAIGRISHDSIRRMRAIVVREFGPADVMKLETVPTPSPGPKQVLVRIRAAGVNPVETYIRAGTYARKPSLPYTPGADGAGLVESVGADVQTFKHGDHVYIAGDNVTAVAGAGTYAEYAVCSEAMVHRLPPQVSFDQGAAMGVPYGTAYRALFMKAAAKPGETVFVHGATGGVGTAAV